MGEKKLLLPADEFHAIRLQCTHCHTPVIFTLDTSDELAEARCSSCGVVMEDAQQVVNRYREFFTDLRHFAKGRTATFEIAWRDDV
jgi:transcription elongation factor Elf1